MSDKPNIDYIVAKVREHYAEEFRIESLVADRSVLVSEIERLREALSELVKTNEQHNEAVEAVIGRPLNWNDSYLNKARTVLAETAAKEDTP